jgi:hypothetical protein
MQRKGKRSKGCKATLCFWLCNAKAKGAKVASFAFAFAFASIAKSKGSVVKSKGATVKSKGRHKLRCLLPLRCEAKSKGKSQAKVLVTSKGATVTSKGRHKLLAFCLCVATVKSKGKPKAKGSHKQRESQKQRVVSMLSILFLGKESI